MIGFLRKTLAVIAGAGILASIVVYLLSFTGVTLYQQFRWFLFLHIGVFILLIPISLIERSAVRSGTFYWKGFASRMPHWAVPTIKVLGGLAIAHFLLFLALTHAGSPSVKNGEYSLDDHGRTVRVLSKEEYLSLRGVPFTKRLGIAVFSRILDILLHGSGFLLVVPKG
jgi:hypothetical protein